MVSRQKSSSNQTVRRNQLQLTEVVVPMAAMLLEPENGLWEL